MPAVRFSRDKRGYEYVYLVHTPMRRGKPGRSRVLYWYRTPPGVRIGRQPFNPDVQKLIEQQNPGLTFDWDAIVNTPMPPPDMTEYLARATEGRKGGSSGTTRDGSRRGRDRCGRYRSGHRRGRIRDGR
ncbi:MAG: hypothetical protein QM736_11780 [Vicinamibacterales bacterium]